MVLWETIAIVVAAIWALTNILDKYALTKLVRSASLNELSLFIQVILAFIVLGIHGIAQIPSTILLIALLAGALEAVSIFLYYDAAKLDEISSVLPVWYLDTAFIAIIAGAVLGEVFTPSTYLGIGLMVIGVFLLGIKIKHRLRLSKAMSIMILASLTAAISVVMLKYVLGFTDYLSAFIYVTLGYGIVLLPLLVKNRARVVNMLTTNRKGTVVLVTKEGMTAFGNLLYVLAAVSGPIALVNALSSLQPLFLLIFAVIVSAMYPALLKEEIKGTHIAIKLCAIALILIATYIIAA
ncbi:MAG: DMT family transporter [Candidatus Micrarchaeota archaeon]|nr:DMT family transporter [Candidatus Micrarchaeota archaeon]